MKITKRGYILIYAPDHPFHQRGGWILEHRVVMEKKINRYLTKEEVIHHIDGNKLNNSIINLMLFKSHGDHIKYHLDNGGRENLRNIGYKRKQTEKTKEKCSMAKLGNKHCVGRKYSRETIEKMKKSQRDRRELERYATAY